MDKEILSQYIDACELIKETEEDIRRVKRQRKTILQDRVHGSMKEFPYTAQSFKIQGDGLFGCERARSAGDL